MRDLFAFLLLLILLSLLWGRVLWYLDERSRLFRRLVFFFIGFTHRPVGEVKAALLTGIYCFLGLAAAILLAAGFRLAPARLLSFSATQAAVSVLGAMGEISLSDLLVGLACLFAGPRVHERFKELKEVPWMAGLRLLPDRIVPAAAALAGVVEELFFRGVVIFILVDRFDVRPVAAAVIAGVLFCVEQLVQLQTTFQMLVIGCGCVAISAVGGLLVIVTGSVVPALFCHASFVLFFMPRSGFTSKSHAPG